MTTDLVQGSKQWHDARLGMVTASVAAGCLRLNPHMSAQKAYRMIMGLEEDRMNPWMQYGIDNEPRARQEYEIISGNLVEETGFHVYQEYPFVGASPDGLVGDDGLIEIKCIMSGIMPKKVPIYHRIQMTVQMVCTDRKWCDYFVWHESGYFLERVYPKGAKGLIRKLAKFYFDYVSRGIEPLRKKPPPRRKKHGRDDLVGMDHDLGNFGGGMGVVA